MAYNRDNKYCCNGHVTPRPSSENIGCCDTKAYDKTKEKCCDGEVFSFKDENSMMNYVCCGRNVQYESFNSKYFCCNDSVWTLHRGQGVQRHKLSCCNTELYDHTENECCKDGSVMKKGCCGKVWDDSAEICCGGEIRSKDDGFKCCGSRLYRLGTCCDGVLWPYEGLGFECCNDVPMFPIVSSSRWGPFQRCCRGIVYEYPESRDCCGSTPYTAYNRFSPDKRRCCAGKVFEDRYSICIDGELVPQEVEWRSEKVHCEDFVKEYETHGCCAGVLYEKKQNGTEYVCCNGQLVENSTRLHFCEDRCYNNSDDLECCGKYRYNATSEVCCIDRIYTMKPNYKCFMYLYYNNETEYVFGDSRGIHGLSIMKDHISGTFYCHPNRIPYNRTSEMCCYGKVYPKYPTDDYDMGCSDGRPYNRNTHEWFICSPGVHVVRKGTGGCCKGKTMPYTLYDTTTQICCGPEESPKVYPKISLLGEVQNCSTQGSSVSDANMIKCGDVQHPKVAYSTACCGSTLYHSSNQSVICCNDTLHHIPQASKSFRCAGSELYDRNTHVRCYMSDRVEPRNADGYRCCTEKEYKNGECVCGDPKMKHMGFYKNAPGFPKNIGCCNIVPYNLDTEICCQGKHPFPKFRGNLTQECCGQRTYDPTSQLCCPGVTGFEQVHPKSSPHSECCGKDATYDPNSQVCCTGSESLVYEKNGRENLKCCWQTGVYDPDKEVCCLDQYLFTKKADHSCCMRYYIPNSKTCYREYQPFIDGIFRNLGFRNY